MAMRSRPGLTPVLTIVLLVVVAIGIIAAVVGFTTGLLGNYLQDLRLTVNTEVTVKDVSVDDTAVYVQNTGNVNVTPEFWADSEKILETQLSPQDTTPLPPGTGRWYQLDCIPQGATTMRIEAGGTEYVRSIGTVPEQYCIEIMDIHIETEGLNTYKVFEGKVYLNNKSHTPYAKKTLEYRFDDEVKTVETDADGRFELKTLWAVNYLPQHGIWKNSIRYTSETPVIDFHRGKGRFQPPNRIRLEYEDGVTEVVQTQEVMEEVENNHFDLVYNVIPESITEDTVTFKIAATLDPKPGLEQDWNNHPNAKLLYQVAMGEGNGWWGGPYTPVQSLRCSASGSVTCSAGEVQFDRSTNVRGTTFDSTSLPENDDGQKYIPVRFNTTASSDAVTGINPLYRMHHGGQQHNNPAFDHRWYFLFDLKHMAYLPAGKTVTTWRNITLDRLRNEVNDHFSDPDAEINTSYLLRSRLVPTPHLWWAPPMTAEQIDYFWLNRTDHEGFTSRGDGEGSWQTVLYRWNEMNADRTYDLNFTVTLERQPDDTMFTLPVTLGTFGMFPRDGGEALNVGSSRRGRGTYYNGGIRYAPFRNTGSFSFRTVIPGTESSTRALVYKTTIPHENDEWTANTYVLNANPVDIERIYLLNSRGQWNVYETTEDGDGWLKLGEHMKGVFTVDQKNDELVQLNLQTQLANGGASEPEYDDWPYTFNLTITNTSGQTTHNLSYKIRCNTRRCGSFLVGHGDEARPIDNLRYGQEAPRSLFSEVANVEFDLENTDQNDAAGFRLKEMKFWTWYLEPFTFDLENDLSENPDKLEITTTEHAPYKPGRYMQRFQ